MAQTPQQELDAAKAQRVKLLSQMASGVIRAESADTGSVTYREYDDQRKALADLDARIAGLEAQTLGAGARRRLRRIVLTGGNGW
jgi:hypothetical protein